MKAVLCKDWGPPDALVVEDIPSPAPGKGQLLVSVKASGVNFPDVLLIQNKYQFKPELPFSPGSEIAGVVKQAGEGVHGFMPGDRVMAHIRSGGYAEEVVVDEALVTPVPAGLEFTVAASFGLVYATAYHALKDRAKIQSGETLLVLGAAGMAARQEDQAAGERELPARARRRRAQRHDEPQGSGKGRADYGPAVNGLIAGIRPRSKRPAPTARDSWARWGSNRCNPGSSNTRQHPARYRPEAERTPEDSRGRGKRTAHRSRPCCRLSRGCDGRRREDGRQTPARDARPRKVSRPRIPRVRRTLCVPRTPRARSFHRVRSLLRVRHPHPCPRRRARRPPLRLPAGRGQEESRSVVSWEPPFRRTRL